MRTGRLQTGKRGAAADPHHPVHDFQINEELKPMKDIRYWVSKVLSPEQTGEKQPEPKHSLKERLQYEQEQKKQKQVQKAPKQKKQDMEL